MGSGVTLERNFTLPQARNWVIVNYYQNGTMDALWRPTEPVYD